MRRWFTWMMQYRTRAAAMNASSESVLPLVLHVAAGGLVGVAVLALVFYAPLYPDLDTVAFSSTSCPELKGPLSPNGLLDSAVHLVPHVRGAESVTTLGDDLITGLVDGRLVRIRDNQIVQVIVDCQHNASAAVGVAPQCGRPLGIRVDEWHQVAYVADSVKGLYKVDLRTGEVTTLFAASQPIGGRRALLTDDLTISREGDIYFTDASTRWPFHQLHLDFAEARPNGRILHYDPVSNTTRLLLDDLYFPNGIQLSPDEDHFLFCETSRFRIMKYYLRGPSKGHVELFGVDNLPGYPDNIRLSDRDTYWVAMVFARRRGTLPLLEWLGPYPKTRKVLVRLAYMLSLPFRATDKFFQRNDHLYVSHLVDQLVMTLGGGPRYGLVLEMDLNGKILRSLHSQTGHVHSLSQAHEHRGVLYLGSPWELGVYALKL